MTKRVFDNLPAPLRALVDEVETAMGTDILLEATGGVPKRMCGKLTLSDPVKVTLMFALDPSEVVPCYSSPYAAFCHELLHLRRTFVETVPAIFQIDGMEYEPITDHPVYTSECLEVYSVRGLEMLLEHIVIEPQVERYGIKHQPVFIRPEVWDTIPPLPWKHEALQRWLCMRAWVLTQFHSCDRTREAAERAMEKLGLLALARHLTGELQWLRDSPDVVEAKEVMCLTACAVLGVNPSKVHLMYHLKPGCNESRSLPHSIQLRHSSGAVIPFEW
jgi:hypothetical protein